MATYVAENVSIDPRAEIDTADFKPKAAGGSRVTV